MNPQDIYDSYFEMPPRPDVRLVSNIAYSSVGPEDRFWATGLGKSGLVAQKFVGTARSLKLQANFIHPVDGLHGDSGMIQQGDVIIAVSASGETQEVIDFCLHMQFQLPVFVIAVTSSRPNRLRRVADQVIPVADPSWDAGHMPSASFITACCALDMLAVAVAGDRAIMHHPGGEIGRKLRTGSLQ